MIGLRSRVYGHMGELVQGRLGPGGPVALISLPSPALYVEATVQTGSFGLWQPHGGALHREDFRRMSNMLGAVPRGRWQVSAHMPVGEGAGASTAALLAVGRLIAPRQDAGSLMRICLQVEGASDPLLSPALERLLWASRLGKVLGHLPPVPQIQIVGGFYGPKRRTDPADDHFPDVSDIIAAWPAACADPQALANLISLSSQRTMALRGGDFSVLRGLQDRFGALGVAIAHTGSAAAFILPLAGDPGPLVRVLNGLGWRYVHGYRLGETKDV